MHGWELLIQPQQYKTQHNGMDVVWYVLYAQPGSK